jgi:predicted nucleotidyltransferase
MGHLGIDRACLARFLQEVAARFPLERVLLLGSRARGDEVEDSHYDLMLVLPDLLGRDRQSLRRGLEGAGTGLAWPEGTPSG